jgi:hypothetical protein
MIKFILNKQEASNKAKRKKENKSRDPGIERFIPGNDAKMLSSLYTPGVTWKKHSIHLVCPWGQVSNQGAIT